MFSFQAGYFVSIAMLIIGYTVVVLTVLSISAIATSANVETGGVYCILTSDMNYYKLYCVPSAVACTHTHTHTHTYTHKYTQGTRD